MKQADIDALRGKSIAPQGLFIDGDWTQPLNGGRLDVLSPIDSTVITTIADAGAEDVDRAVQAARAAFEKGSWSRMAPAGRKKVLLKLADLIEAHALELAVLGVRDNGTEISMAYKAEPLSAAGTFRYYAEAIDKVYGEIAPTQADVLALIHREPLGVVAAIVPWNFPMMIGAWKVGAGACRGQFGRAEAGGAGVIDPAAPWRACRGSRHSRGRVQRGHRAGQRHRRGARRCIWMSTPSPSPARAASGAGCWNVRRART
jgi:gamma-glutamyl-gamma-aminobutyraldehyde dehydrogenase